MSEYSYTSNIEQVILDETFKLNLRYNDSILEVKLNKKGKSLQKSPIEIFN